MMKITELQTEGQFQLSFLSCSVLCLVSSIYVITTRYIRNNVSLYVETVVTLVVLVRLQTIKT